MIQPIYPTAFLGISCEIQRNLFQVISYMSLLLEAAPQRDQSPKLPFAEDSRLLSSG